VTIFAPDSMLTTPLQMQARLTRSLAVRVGDCLIGFVLPGRRSGLVVRLCLGGCGCIALLVARPALATPPSPSGQLVWETSKAFVLTKHTRRECAGSTNAARIRGAFQGRAFAVRKLADVRQPGAC
jgi:hypothetical protein